MLASFYSETVVTMERIDFSTQSAHCQAVGKRICELANSSDGLTLQIYL